MKSLVIQIEKKAVYDEIARTTDYTGNKMIEPAEGFSEKVATVDEDAEQLDRFWSEACVDVTEALKHVVGTANDLDTEFFLQLELNASWDDKLGEAMRKELFSFMVMSIISKWYVFMNRTEAAEYAAGAASLLEGVHRKAVFKRKPTRPIYPVPAPPKPEV